MNLGNASSYVKKIINDEFSLEMNNSMKFIKRETPEGKVEVMNWNDGKLNEETLEEKITNSIKVTVLADDFNSFQETTIKKEIENTVLDNYSDKITAKNPDYKFNLKMITSKNISVNNSSASCTVVSGPATQNNKVFVLKSVSGKTVKLVPKSIHKLENNKLNVKSTASNQEEPPKIVQTSTFTQANDPQSNCGVHINPNNASKLKISLLKGVERKLPPETPKMLQFACIEKTNPSGYKLVQNQNNSHMFNKTNIGRHIKHNRPILPKENLNTVTKPLQYKITSISNTKTIPKMLIKDIKHSTLPANPVKKTIQYVQPELGAPTIINTKFITTDEKSLIYANSYTQTERICADVSVQTDILEMTDDLPDIEQLVEYLMETPKYSTGIEEDKKSNLLGMSKNIKLKGKLPLPNKNVVNTIPTREKLKIQLFMDLNNCVNFDSSGNMPIHNAILENNLNALKKQCFVLLLRNSGVNIPSNHGLTPLQMALINNCCTEVIVELLRSGADTSVLDQEGNSTLHLTVLHSTPAVLQIIIRIGQPSRCDMKNDEGMTALMLACIHNKQAMVEILLKSGADPNITDEKSGRTAFFHAVENDANEITQLLLRNNANPKIRNFLGLTALDAAKDSELVTMSLLEEKNGASTYAATNSSYSSAVNYLSTSDTNDSTENSYEVNQSRRNRKNKFNFVTSYKKVEFNNVNAAGKRRRFH